ncbi:MAG: flagellar biosynthesis protein FlhA [Hyphomonadaceae bacterium]|nr:MAG: flagellar biosynthesis protein FlhA [Caulobacteraceae bacterium]MBT9446040.1 flagellar biosynthesis protein FlhA [Hyphomonadaceae bacterium]TPW07622.1 MAG: flagellar biosynthesis protein FlhA [Alphaproteobacteria bacterium]
MSDAAQPQGALPDFMTVVKSALRGEVYLAAAVLFILAILLVPLPAWFMDFLLAISITSSVLVLMTALLIKRPLEFTAFPTVLLLTTLFRLALNVASTRLILSHGHTGPDAAGQVINAFGEFVMQGNFIIGVIVFIILIIVNFVVITRGSTRIAEVAARFTLDAMPGKQMAVDSDLSSGLIDEKTAKKRRKELEEESNFFGAMDGASKFVRGDAIAALLITAINIIGGIIIGMASHQLPFGEAADHYTRLTVGEGLVAQVPSLIISVAAGLLVAKAGVEGAADKALARQLASYPPALGMVSACAFIAGILPGMPVVPFFALAAASGLLAWRLRGSTKAREDAEIAETQPKEAAPTEETPTQALAMDDVRIELGFGLLSLLNEVQGRRLTDQIRALRKSLAQELGFVTPQVRILDNVQIGPDEYVIRVREMEAGKGRLKLGALLAMDPSGAGVTIPGEPVKEPAFGLDATWIDESSREDAAFRGYTVVDPATVLATHLTEIVKEYMGELLTFSEVKKLIKELPKDTQSLLDDVAPTHISWSGIQRVLQNLLRERVSIRDLGAIVEAIAEAAPATHDLVQITEHVRARLARQISFQHQGHTGFLPIVTLSPAWEQTFAEALVGERGERQLSLAPSKLHQFVADVRQAFEKAAREGETPVLLTSPLIRPYVRSLVERFRAATAVMSQGEVHPKARLKSCGQI